MTSKKFMDEYQFDAAEKLKSGNILVGGTGAGKSRTAIYWWFRREGGAVGTYGVIKKLPLCHKPLYIITTAQKRDLGDWIKEFAPFGVNICEDEKIFVDSWNNIAKYVGVTGSTFIFDEDHLTGKGKWVRSFYKIARANTWIVLTATPGDDYMQYYPVFHANGFFKSKREFEEGHVVYNPHTPFPSVIRYLGTRRLDRLRDRITVQMDYTHHIIPHHEDVICEFDKDLYREVMKTRWNVFEGKPIENATEYCYVLRKICNSDPSRMTHLYDILNKKKRIIVFYNFDYELDLIKEGLEGFVSEGFEVAEWNGHKHESLPRSGRWVYLVNYNAGAEGWNAITCDSMIFYSQNYSYKTMIQAAGRIDRRNTPFSDLFYYHFLSNSIIDRKIFDALKCKKKFNEKKFSGF